MNGKQKLELTWIGKEQRPRLEPRILLVDPEMSYHAAQRVTDHDLFDNRLIFGDNLLALKALEQEFTGKIKCIYIDPPFNTGQAMEHYDDALEHSIWLSLMYDRLVLLRRLLSPEGVIFIHIDTEENHYLKVLLDELFGRPQFLGQVAYERSGVSGIGQGGTFLVNTHEQILCYARDKGQLRLCEIRGEAPLELKDMKRYSKVFRSPGNRREVARFVAPATGEDVIIYQHDGYAIDSITLRRAETRLDELQEQYATEFSRVFRTTSVQEENEFQNRILSFCAPGLYSADYLVSRGKRGGQRVTAYYWNQGVFAWLADTAELRDGRVVKINKLSDFWTHGELPKADLANEGGVDFRRGKKPEALMRRLLRIATSPGDWVLDSFAGSGTTGAVAHKMGRRWIMVELGQHCRTHIIPRLKKVINGIDQGGITEAVGWKGGGGFRYYRLAPSLLERDRWGNWVISKQYNAAMLAEAMCKHEGFVYAPSQETYWQHGHSTERDFIYVTTQTLTHEQLAQISEDVGEDRSLLICCGAFRSKAGAFPNLTLKKIPSAVLGRCEFGRDDYSLRIANLPTAPAAIDQTEQCFTPTETPPAPGRRRKIPEAPTLPFGDGEPGDGR